jgi:hypothetical protein
VNKLASEAQIPMQKQKKYEKRQHGSSKTQQQTRNLKMVLAMISEIKDDTKVVQIKSSMK